jgi:hypothetical protein
VVIVAKAKTKPPERILGPLPGRRAYICEGRKGEPCNRRRFIMVGEPIPECDTHGKMVRQVNRPYRDQEVPS